MTQWERVAWTDDHTSNSLCHSGEVWGRHEALAATTPQLGVGITEDSYFTGVKAFADRLESWIRLCSTLPLFVRMAATIDCTAEVESTGHAQLLQCISKAIHAAGFGKEAQYCRYCHGDLGVSLNHVLTAPPVLADHSSSVWWTIYDFWLVTCCGRGAGSSKAAINLA